MDVARATTLISASDLHNARVTVLNSFCNMEYRIINTIKQNKPWIEAHMPCINFNPNRYNALAQTIVYVSNDVTISCNAVTSQKNTMLRLSHWCLAVVISKFITNNWCGVSYYGRYEKMKVCSVNWNVIKFASDIFCGLCAFIKVFTAVLYWHLTCLYICISQ